MRPTSQFASESGALRWCQKSHIRGAQAWNGSHSFTCNYINAGFYLVSVHQMAPLQTEVADI